MTLCRRGLVVDPPPASWLLQPLTDLPPDPTTDAPHSVVIYGANPKDMRCVRVPSGWLRRGRRVHERLICWAEVGLCLYRVPHPVLDARLVAGVTGLSSSEGGAHRKEPSPSAGDTTR